MLQEVVIQRDVPARVGMRVVVRKVALSLNPTLAKQSRGRTGTITWIEPSSAEEGVEHGSRVEVVWDGSFEKILGEFRAAHYIEHITLQLRVCSEFVFSF